MKNIIFGFVLFLLVTSAWAGTFKDNFDDGNDDGWTHWGNSLPNPIGKWEFVNEEYTITVTTLWAGSIRGEKKWADYTIELSARSIDGEGCLGIVFRIQDAQNGYVWALSPAPNTLSWWQEVNGWISRETQDPAPGDGLKEHRYKVVALGSQFKGYYDGQLIREWQHNLFKTGRVGIIVGCNRGKATFDDFVITGDDVPNSGFAVELQDKLTTTWGSIKNDR